MRVLYVEDEKFLAEAVKHNLGKEEIDCDLALDGEDGLNKAIDSIYDVVILVVRCLVVFLAGMIRRHQIMKR